MSEHHKKLKRDGAIYHLLRDIATKEYRIHNWEGPAIEPVDKDCKVKRAWYINGIEYSKDDWQAMRKGREGLPPSKQKSPKGSTNRA